MWHLPADLISYNNGLPIAHRLKVQDKFSLLSREILKRTHGKNLTMEEYARRFGGYVMPGYQFRYIYFLDPEYRDRLTVPILPFSTIQELGASMYKGKSTRAGSIGDDVPDDQSGEGGSTPTPALQYKTASE